MNVSRWVLALLFFFGAPVIAFEILDRDFKDVSGIANVKVDLRYATADNFTGVNQYGDFKTGYLHRDAFAKLEGAAKALAARKPGYSLLIYDALRPRRVQRKLFAHVKGTPQEPYVADPDLGSVHNYGFAVDLTVADAKGKPLDMGTPYDDFTELAEPRHEERFLKEGKLTKAQVENRRLLRDVMEGAGFKVIPNEWWHFDARPPKEVRAKYKIVE